METSTLSSKLFWGMVIYNKTGNGTLCGLWKNNALPNGTIVNEIARKKKDSPNTSDPIEGTYTVSWIEENDEALIGILKITIIENNQAYSFEWIRNTTIFRGVGMPIGENQIAVTYWDSSTSVTLNF